MTAAGRSWVAIAYLLLATAAGRVAAADVLALGKRIADRIYVEYE